MFAGMVMATAPILWSVFEPSSSTSRRNGPIMMTSPCSFRTTATFSSGTLRPPTEVMVIVGSRLLDRDRCEVRYEYGQDAIGMNLTQSRGWMHLYRKRLQKKEVSLVLTRTPRADMMIMRDKIRASQVPLRSSQAKRATVSHLFTETYR